MKNLSKNAFGINDTSKAASKHVVTYSMKYLQKYYHFYCIYHTFSAYTYILFQTLFFVDTRV